MIFIFCYSFQQWLAYVTSAICWVFVLLHQKRTYSKLQKFFVSSQWFPSLFIPLFVTFRKLVSNFFMVKILKVFDFCFAQSGNRDFLSVTSSFIYFTSMFQKLFLSLLLFIIAIKLVVFINRLLFVLAYFCFRGAVLLSAVLQISRQKSGSRVFWNICNRCFSLENFLEYKKS